MAFHSVAATSGILFVVLIIVATALSESGMPGVEAAGNDIAAYVEQDQALHRWSIPIAALAIPFAAIFFAAVIGSLKDGSLADGETWATVALFGAVALVAAASTGDALLSALIFRGGDGMDDSTLLALYDAQRLAYTAIGPGIATLTTAVAVPSLLYGVWPRWHGGLGLAVAVVGIAAPFASVAVSDTTDVLTYFAFPALPVWTLATSVLLFRRPGAQAS